MLNKFCFPQMHLVLKISFKKYYYLFISGRTGSLLLHAGSSLVSTSQGDSLVMEHRPSCPRAGGIFPDQDANPCPCVGGWILNHWTTREVHMYIFECPFFILLDSVCDVFKDLVNISQERLTLVFPSSTVLIML